MPYGLLILSVLKPGTGNYTTASRIASYFSSSQQFSVQLKCCSSFLNSEDLRIFVENNMIEVVIGVHLYRSGKLLTALDVPFVLIIGGTDINCCSTNEKRMSVMTCAVQKAHFVLAFSGEMKTKAMTLWPGMLERKIVVQPQAVTTCPSRCFSYEDLPLDRKVTWSRNSSKNFLLVAGIRPVKDPLFLAEAVSKWHKEDSSVHLFIVGPDLDDRFAENCRLSLSNLPGVHMCPYVNISDIHALMKHSIAVVNSSISEGMAVTILEAMQLGVPVLARRNPGNMSLIAHGENGLLFTSEDEFIGLAKLLLSDISFAHHLASNGRNFVNLHHNCQTELVTYCTILENILFS